MKKTIMMFLCGTFLMLLSACSGDEIIGEAQEPWDGNGVPRWFEKAYVDKRFEFFYFSSDYYLGHFFFDAYRFDYMGKPYIAFDYKYDGGTTKGNPKFKYKLLEWGLEFYTNDGRRIKSSSVEKAYKKESKKFCSINLPVIIPEELVLHDGTRIDWMCQVIADTYKKYDNKKVLEVIAVKTIRDENLVVLFEMYMTSKKSNTSARFFTLDGKELTNRYLVSDYTIIAETGKNYDTNPETGKIEQVDYIVWQNIYPELKEY